jgi:hypothetical protein
LIQFPNAGTLAGNFCGWRIAEAIPAGLAPLRQRVAANSLCLKGSEFVPRAAKLFEGSQGIRKAGQGIGNSAIPGCQCLLSVFLLSIFR